MSDKKKDSLFSEHLKILEIDDSSEPLSPDLLAKKEEIESTELPPLRLPEEEPSFAEKWDKFWQSFKVPIGIAGMACLALFVFVPQFAQKDQLNIKGTTQVRFYYEREGVVAPMREETKLKDGDKVAASVISDKPTLAFWAVSDENFDLLSDSDQVLGSRLVVEAGKMTSFPYSFTLVPPNQGEVLVVVVCELATKETDVPKDVVKNLMNRDFMKNLADSSSIDATACVFVGRKLRHSGEQ